jgi:hypothetical protein
MNAKDDRPAKEALRRLLLRAGYTSVELASPVDIVATRRDGVREFFEVKKTGKTGVYFGAATQTEWGIALKHPSSFWFVVARETSTKMGWTFDRLRPDEFAAYSYIPPYKVYFQVPIAQGRSLTAKQRRKGRVLLARMKRLNRAWSLLFVAKGGTKVPS